MLPEYVDWEEISEETIEELMQVVRSSKNGTPEEREQFNISVASILLAGNEYRKAGLEPIYVINEDTTKIMVYAEETVDRSKLH